MLRNSRPFWVALIALITGCDFFSTREVLPKPSDIRAFQGLGKRGDSLSFLVTETLREPGVKTDKEVLSKRRLLFVFLGDTIVSGDTLKLISLRITEDPSGDLVESSQRMIHFSKDGLLLTGLVTGASARFYPFKAGVAEDSSTYLVLPAVFSEGWNIHQSMGRLDLYRNLQASTDTLAYHGHSEATWGITETVKDAGIILNNGHYWYGASGLLKAEQTWTNFGWRDASASPQSKVDLLRTLVRQ
jgi:hypothetical protein